MDREQQAPRPPARTPPNCHAARAAPPRAPGDLRGIARHSGAREPPAPPHRAPRNPATPQPPRRAGDRAALWPGRILRKLRKRPGQRRDLQPPPHRRAAWPSRSSASSGSARPRRAPTAGIPGRTIPRRVLSSRAPGGSPIPLRSRQPRGRITSHCHKQPA